MRQGSDNDSKALRWIRLMWFTIMIMSNSPKKGHVPELGDRNMYGLRESLINMMPKPWFPVIFLALTGAAAAQERVKQEGRPLGS